MIARSNLRTSFVLSFALVAAPLAPDPPEGYLEILRDYRGGDVEGTLLDMASLSSKDIRALANEFSLSPLRLSAEDTKAAILLHTQAGLVNEARGDRKHRDAHLELAGTLAKTLGRSDFQRNWLGSLGYYYQSTLEERKAVEVFERLTQQYPEAAVGWLGWGTVLETVASVGSPSSPQVGLLASPWHAEEIRMAPTRREKQRRGFRRAKLSRARDLYEEASSREPQSGEIRLRLGRSSELLGEEHAAREHYAWVIQNGSEEFHEAMARLFIGRMLERSGAIDAAVVQYREAMLVDPSLQTTYLALSHALQVSGKRHASKTIMTSALRLGELEPNSNTGRSRYLFRLDAFVDSILSLQSELTR